MGMIWELLLDDGAQRISAGQQIPAEYAIVYLIGATRSWHVEKSSYGPEKSLEKVLDEEYLHGRPAFLHSGWAFA